MLSSFVQVVFGTIYVLSYCNLAGRILYICAFAAPVRYFIIFFDICVRLKEGIYLLHERSTKCRNTPIFLGASSFEGLICGWNAKRLPKM